MTTRSQSTLTSILAAALFLLGLLPSQPPANLCQSLVVTRDRAQAITDSIGQVHASGPDDPVWSGFAHSTVGIRFGTRCLTALALSWNGLHNGAIVILDSTGIPLYADDHYRAVADLVQAGDGRVGFRYNSVWGSGIWETRFIVLCALTPDVWDECLNVVLDKRTYATGYPPGDSMASLGASLEQTGSVKVLGDTVFLTRRVLLKRSDQAKPRVRYLGTARLLLP